MAHKHSSPEFQTHAFSSSQAFEDFLEREHATAPGIYLKLAKKGSEIPSVTSAEAVEVALCFGWIDGRANSIDEKWWTVRYTPRRAKSIWSQKNVATIARLIEEGKMRPAGLATVDAAKADGRWDRAYAGPATMTTPGDLEQALAAEPTAKAYFDSLNKSEKYSVLWPLATVSAKNRAVKISSLVQNLATGQIPGATLPKKKTTAKISGTLDRKRSTGHGSPRSSASTRVADRRKFDKAVDPPRRSGLRSQNADL